MPFSVLSRPPGEKPNLGFLPRDRTLIELLARLPLEGLGVGFSMLIHLLRPE